MNENNLDYLQNTLKYLGFGESLNEKLKESVEKGLPEFMLRLDLKMPAPNAKDKPELADAMQYQLQFSKSKETDLYFFNKYQAFLEPASDKYATVDQNFYINKGKGVTAKESYNLLSGRAVNKDVVLKSGEKTNMWLKLDLKERDPDKGYAMNTYGEQYGFDLKATVDKYHLPEMNKPGYRDQLLKSLERGNLHEITFMKNGKESSGFVTANPQFKSLDFYDMDLSQVYSKAVDRHDVAEQKKAVKVAEVVTEKEQTSKEKAGVTR